MAESANAARKPPCTMPVGLAKRSSATMRHTVRPGSLLSMHTIPRVRSQFGGTCTRDVGGWQRRYTLEARPDQCSSRSSRLSSLPLSVRGSSSRTSHDRGPLVARPGARRRTTSSAARSSVAPGAGLHDRVHLLAPLVVGNAEDGRVHHVGMRVEHRLDLGRVDVHPAADDHVLLAVADVDEALVVDARHVADRLPRPPGVVQLAQLLRGLVVAVHRQRGADVELAGLARRATRGRRRRPPSARCGRRAARTSPACAAGPRAGARCRRRARWSRRPRRGSRRPASRSPPA